MCVQIQEKELSEAEGWGAGLRAVEWVRMRERETGRSEYEYRVFKDSAS
jgi:hypothetical protein